jgi:hypothetical protein
VLDEVRLVGDHQDHPDRRCERHRPATDPLGERGQPTVQQQPRHEEALAGLGQMEHGTHGRRFLGVGQIRRQDRQFPQAAAGGREDLLGRHVPAARVRHVEVRHRMPLINDDELVQVRQRGSA